jgi:hypothetical protein
VAERLFHHVQQIAIGLADRVFRYLRPLALREGRGLAVLALLAFRGVGAAPLYYQRFEDHILFQQLLRLGQILAEVVRLIAKLTPELPLKRVEVRPEVVDPRVRPKKSSCLRVNSSIMCRKSVSRLLIGVAVSMKTCFGRSPIRSNMR